MGLLFTFVNYSYAQSRTGGGGIIDEEKLPALPDNEGGSQGITSSTPEGIIHNLTISLERQDKECRTEGHRFLELKESDFMQAYLKLSILKSSFVADNKCQDLSTYLKCLYSPEVKGRVERFLSDKKMNYYLKKKYGIKSKEAKEIKKFFKHIDSACGKDGCKM